MAYLLDTNVFIKAKNRQYGFDFCPAFCDWIDHAHQAGTVFNFDYYLAAHGQAHQHVVVTRESATATTPKNTPTEPCRARR
jgi:predicted nucleic acid-binding protein